MNPKILKALENTKIFIEKNATQENTGYPLSCYKNPYYDIYTEVVEAITEAQI